MMIFSSDQETLLTGAWTRLEGCPLPWQLAAVSWLVLWFRPSQQLGSHGHLLTAPYPSGTGRRIRENKVKLAGWDKTVKQNSEGKDKQQQ